MAGGLTESVRTCSGVRMVREGSDDAEAGKGLERPSLYLDRLGFSLSTYQFAT